MSATCARVTSSLPCGNPNASRMDERPVQLTRTDGHNDNPVLTSLKLSIHWNSLKITNIVLDVV